MIDGQILALIILVGAVALSISEVLRADIVALLVVFALAVTGVLTPQEALSGFGRETVLIIAAIFVMAEGLRRSGLADRTGRLLVRLGGKSEARLTAATILAGALLSLFMNNLAAASVLLPAVATASRKTGVSPSRLFMPLAFGTILGGMATLFTTANIVVSGILRSEGLRGFSVLDFAPVGLPIVAAGVVFMAVWGRRLLPADPAAKRLREIPDEPQDLVGLYRLGEILFRARIPAGSFLDGRPLARSGFRETYALSVLAIERGGRVEKAPPPDTILHAGDILVLEGDVDDFRRRDVEPLLEVLPAQDWLARDLESFDTIVFEAMLAPRSRLVGQTLHGARFRQKYGMSVLAIWRANHQIREGIRDIPLQFGDAILLQGPRNRLAMLRESQDLIVLLHEPGEVPAAPQAWKAAIIMAGALGLAAFHPTLIAEAMLGGALLMVMTRTLSVDESYRAIEWKSVVLVAGMLPLGLALAKTGAAASLASHVLSIVSPFGAIGAIAALVLVAVILTQGISGPVVAAIMTPVALRAAASIGADPRSFAMGIALASSVAFVTPLGHPVNVLVMGQGGYRFRDYVRAGLPLALVVLIVMAVLLPLCWPLTPRG